MAVANGELYQVTLSGIYLGQTIENVLMFRARDSTVTNAAIDTALKSFWHNLRQLFDHQYKLTYMMVKRVTPIALDTIFVSATTGEEDGAQSGDGIASTVAAVVTLRTGTSGKSHRGRMYIAPVALGMTDTSGSRLSSGALLTFASTMDLIKNEFDDATGTSLALALGIYSRVIGGTSPYTAAGWQAVSQYVTQPILGNQRRRRIGRGA